MQIINSFLLPLVLTVAVEGLTAAAFGFRGRYFFLVLALVNVITNPLLNWMLSVIRLLELPGSGYMLLLLEAGAAAVEWRLLVYAFPGETKRYLVLSAVMNIASYLTGMLVLHR